MITLEEKQQIARENGKRSRGPITDAGKAKCAQNPIKHGLASKKVVLAHESQEAFDQLLQTQRDAWLPADDREDLLVVNMVNAHWRLSRMQAMESAFLDAYMMSHSKDFEAAYPTHHPGLRGMDAFTMAALRSPVALQSFPRYEAHYSRQYYSAFHALLKLRNERGERNAAPIPPATQPTPDTPPTPEPTPKPQPTNDPILRWITALLTYLLAILTKNRPAPPKLPTRPTRTTLHTPKPLQNIFTNPETFSWWTDFLSKEALEAQESHPEDKPVI